MQIKLTQINSPKKTKICKKIYIKNEIKIRDLKRPKKCGGFAVA